jgi:hypothetical protein
VDFTGQNYGDAVAVVYKNTVLQYNAIIVPFEGSDSDLNDGIYSVNLSAECGLVNLKTITFLPSGTRKKLLDVIIECINNIPYVNSFGYSVVDNVDLRDADLNKPYYYESFIEDKFFEGLSCYDVINSIIQQYGQFTFTDGRWDIKNIAEISKVNSVKRTYSNAGVLQSSTAYNRPDESVTRTAGGDFGLMFSQKSVTIEKTKSISRSLNPNSGFENSTGWTFEGLAPLLFEITNGYLTNKGNTWFTEPSNLPDSSYVQSPATTYFPFKSIFDLSTKQELKIKFKSTKGKFIKNLRLQIISVQSTGFNTYYLTNEGTWYRAVAGVNTPIYAADFKDGVEEIIPIPQVPYLDTSTPILNSNIIPNFGEFLPFPYNQPPTDVSYQLYVRVFMPERQYEDFSPLVGAPTILDLTTQIDYIDITAEEINNNSLNGFTKKFGVSTQKDRSGDLTIKLGVGYPSFPVSYDSLFFNGSTTKPITLYNSLPIEEFIADSYLSVLSQRQKFYQGTVIANIEFGDLLDIDGEKHRIHNYEYNYKLKQANIKTIGLGVNADTIEELPVYESDVNLDIDSILNQVHIDMNRKYGDNLNLKFVDKNIQINTLADGQKSLSLRQDFRISRLYSTDVFLRTASDGSIQDVAEDTEGNFTLIKPAKDGTYALLEDIEDLAWLQEGNTATVATKKLGTLDNFDFNIIRNNVNIGQIKSTGLDLLDNRLDVGAVQYNVATAQTVGVAKTIWNDTFGTLEFGLKGGNVNYRLGQSSIVYVKSADNAGLTKGTVVYTVGSDGINKTVRLAQANSESTSSKTFGIIAETVSGGAKAFCITFGNIEGINTSAFAEGATIYLSPTVAGGMTTTKPSAPNHVVVVGFCLRSHATQGVIFVKVQNGFVLDELHDVAIGTLANNNLLAYESSTSLWKNKTFAELGLSSGTGTTNFVTKWSNATGGLTNSQIFDNGVNVGIGTNSPTNKLDVIGTARLTNTNAFPLEVNRGLNVKAVGSASVGIKLGALDVATYKEGATLFGQLDADGNNGRFFVQVRNENVMTTYLSILSSGNVGIGTGTPTQKLDVAGGARFTNDVIIGGGAVGVNSLLVAKNITGGVDASGIRSSGQIQSDVTNSAFIFRAVVNQANFALPTLIVYESQIGTVSGTGTNFINYRAAATSAGFTNVYGFQGAIASGTNRWNLYMSGTAQNHFRGNVGIGASSTVPTTELDVLGITRTTNLRITNGAAVGKVWQCNNVNGTGEWVTPLSSERYIGEWAANSGVAPSASPTTGDYYVVNTAGTYLGITYAAGDEIYWNGTAWLKRSNFLTLPIATASVLGGIKIGTGLAIDGSGVVSVASSPILTTARTISATGDGTWSVSFNGSADVSGALTLANVATEGTYQSVTVNAKGLVTAGTNPTTVSGYGIIDFYAQIVSGFVTGANSTVLDTDSLEVALEKLQGQINARISGNQTITLTGIVTGSGTTAITTAIADASLSIAKTSGLQTALDSKQATLSGTGLVLSTAGVISYITDNSANWNTAFGWGNHASAGYLLASTASTTYQPLDADLTSIAGLTGTTGLLRKTAANTFVLDTATYLTGITSLQVTTALGFTPYNATNPSGFITSSGSITGSAATLTTARTFTIGTTGKTFNGSGNVAWTLGEIGAAPTVHTHAAVDIVSGVIATARLGSGTASATTFLRGDQTWATLPAPTLTSTRIGFGSGSNLLTSSANFTFESDRIIAIKEGTTSKMEVARYIGSSNYGLYVHGGNLELQVISGGNIFSQSNHSFQGRILLNNLAGTAGQVLTSQGSGANPTWTTVSGGTQDLDDVLGVGNTAINKQIILNGTNSVLDSAAIMFYRNGVEKGKLYYDNQFLTLDRLRLTSTSKIQILSEDSVGLYGTSTIIGSLSGTGTRMVVADATGVLSTQAIPSVSIGNIDQVLAAGNTSTEKTFNLQNSTNAYLSFKNNSGALKAQILHVPTFNTVEFNSTSGNKLQIMSGTDLDLYGININMGYSNTTGKIGLQGTPFNFNLSAQNLGMGENGNQWGWNFIQSSPQPGDRIIFFWDGTRFVMSHVHTYTSGGKTYLTID